jgi:PLD-like domain
MPDNPSAPGAAASQAPSQPNAELRKLNDLFPLIERHAGELKQPGVVSVRPGYKLENDWPTKEPAIVVIKSKDAPAVSVPDQIEGVKVDVRDATPAEELAHQNPNKFQRLAAKHSEIRGGAFPEIDPVAETAAPAEPVLDLAAAKKPQIPYTPAAVPLEPLTGNLSFTCHASPDAGWPTLKDFLSKTEKSLTVGLYDFTSAHILEELEKSLAAASDGLELTLDNPPRNPSADQTDPETMKSLGSNLGDSFKAAWALVRQNKEISRWVYPTAYHIKVAVRDSASFWLSSGNWNNSNQPDMDPINDPQPGDQKLARNSDRDWHVVVDNPELAQTFEAYLAHDYEVASTIAPAFGPGVQAVAPAEQMPPEFQVEARAPWKFFAPLSIDNEPATITPLLTPDPGIYQQAMLNLVQSAQERLYIQLQYIHPPKPGEDPSFNALIDAVVDRIDAGVQVRIICSQYQATGGWLERLQASGVDLSVVKIQNNVHNKGFVVDSKVVALGSQNWSGDGVLRNRDASVIIEHARAAKYYETIFLHDWNNVARQSMKQ